MNKVAEDIVLHSDPSIVEKEGVSKRAYQLIYKGKPPWEIGQYQPILEQLIVEENFKSPLIDVGCGLGFNAKYLAENGFKILAVDYLPEVIESAKQKNSHDNIIYKACDIFNMSEELNQYSTVLDFATFHGFSDKARANYASLLARYLQPNTHIYILGFSDQETQQGGPRRLSKKVFAEHFKEGFKIKSIDYTTYKTTIFGGEIKAIVAKIMKL